MSTTTPIPVLGSLEREILEMCLESHGMELDVLINMFWFRQEEMEEETFFGELDWCLRKLFLCGYIRFEYFAVWEEIHWQAVLPLRDHFVYDDRIRWNKDRIGGWRALYPRDFGQKLNAIIADKGKLALDPKMVKG